MAPILDLDFVRSQFPAFEEPTLQGQAFFDSAAGSYACEQVITHLHQYYQQTKLQPYNLHPASQQAGRQMDQSYIRIGHYLNVASEEVHLGPSTSQNTYVLANAFGKILQAGDEIIVTDQDHEANSGVWRRLEGLGITIKEWKVHPETGMLDSDQLEHLFSERTKLLMFPHCSNIVAHINPVAEICQKAKQAGVTTIVDGVSYAGHGFPDIEILGADIYLFSLYKTYGPHLGAMVIRTPIAERLGNQAHFFNDDYKHKWFVPAGPDHAQVAASRGVIDYFDTLHDHHFDGTDSHQEKANRVRSLINSAEKKLLSQLLDFVSNHPKLRLIGPSSATVRVATVSIIPLDQSPEELAQRLTNKGIICSSGHFYSVRLLNAMNIDPNTGVLRLSFTHYTHQDEMNQLISALKQCL
jgi:selenocysteine lyase/cysteine desulfurase